MAIAFIPAQMRSLSAGVDRVEVTAQTVRQVIRALDERFPGLGARLADGASLAPGLAVAIDGAFSSKGLLAPVGPNSEVHFLPALGGG
jgi:molybdopterin synthase sulfur carrier subunit